MFNMGVGLLQGGQPGGTFAGGLNMGMQNMANMQRQQQATALLGAQIQQMQFKRTQAELKAQQAADIARRTNTLPGMNVTSKQVEAVSNNLQPGTPEWTAALQSAPLLNQTINTGNQGDQLRGLTPTEQGVVESGQPYIDTKGALKIAPDLPQVQKTAAGFASRMLSSDDLMGRIDFDMTESFGGRQGILAGELQSDTFQQVRQAEDDWIRAKLRKESGAVIADEEMESERRTYFPQPGDGKQTVLQKKVARIEAANGMLQEASNAYQGPNTQPKVSRGKTQPTDGKPGDIWISPAGKFYVFE